jgi:hypothetical protein
MITIEEQEEIEELIAWNASFGISIDETIKDYVKTSSTLLTLEDINSFVSHQDLLVA